MLNERNANRIKRVSTENSPVMVAAVAGKSVVSKSVFVRSQTREDVAVGRRRRMFSEVVAVAAAVILTLSASVARAQDAAAPAAAADASPEAVQAISGPSDYAQIARACRGRAPDGGYPPEAATPLTVRVLQPIIPVPVTDGYIHLAYVAEAVNVSPNLAVVSAITPVNPAAGSRPTGFNTVYDADGNLITGKIRLFNPLLPQLLDGPKPEKGTDVTRVPGGTAGTTFFDLRYGSASALPRLIAHQVTIQVKDVTSTTQSDPITVTCVPPPVLRPPLIGSGWWNGNGCCVIVGPHRGATLPISGHIGAPESFAIDYVQLNAAGGCCTSGDIHNLAAWPFFGAPILSSADGRIVSMENQLNEQVPAQDPVGVTVANAAGNYIIEEIQGGRYYILYAHLKKGSIPARLHVGSRIRAGEQIGQLGNSGSSTAPHLHFQVMDRPSALDAAGVPFVFTSQKLEGTVQGTLNAAAIAYETGQNVVVDRSTRGWQAFRMPAETQVFGYNLN